MVEGFRDGFDAQLVTLFVKYSIARRIPPEEAHALRAWPDFIDALGQGDPGIKLVKFRPDIGDNGTVFLEVGFESTCPSCEGFDLRIPLDHIAQAARQDDESAKRREKVLKAFMAFGEESGLEPTEASALALWPKFIATLTEDPKLTLTGFRVIQKPGRPSEVCMVLSDRTKQSDVDRDKTLN